MLAFCCERHDAALFYLLPFRHAMPLPPRCPLILLLSIDFFSLLSGFRFQLSPIISRY
jgi:hypothetical protein